MEEALFSVQLAQLGHYKRLLETGRGQWVKHRCMPHMFLHQHNGSLSQPLPEGALGKNEPLVRPSAAALTLFL